jgi:hypothetical protein
MLARFCISFLTPFMRALVSASLAIDQAVIRAQRHDGLALAMNSTSFGPAKRLSLNAITAPLGPIPAAPRPTTGTIA